MSTFLLVHGAMHGGWCWRHVRDELARRGHTVLTPTLTGTGERRGTLGPDVGVDTHVDDLLDVLWFEDLTEVTLVLHSYAGILAGPVVEGSDGRITSVVYLGAFLAEPGQSLLDVEPPAVAERYRKLVADNGGVALPATTAFLDQWGIDDPQLRDWVGPRLTDFPFRCQTDPVRFDPAPLEELTKTYVVHTAPTLASLDRFAAHARASNWRVEELAAGHDMMLAAPLATTELLEQLAVPRVRES